MTNDILYFLLRASISTSLSNREAFINKVAQLIEQHTQENPENARHISDSIANVMESLNSTLLLEQLFKPRRDKKLNATLDSLTSAVEKLNTLLKEAGLPDTPSKPKDK